MKRAEEIDICTNHCTLPFGCDETNPGCKLTQITRIRKNERERTRRKRPKAIDPRPIDDRERIKDDIIAIMKKIRADKLRSQYDRARYRRLSEEKLCR